MANLNLLTDLQKNQTFSKKPIFFEKKQFVRTNVVRNLTNSDAFLRPICCHLVKKTFKSKTCPNTVRTAGVGH